MTEWHAVTQWQRNPEVEWLLEQYLKAAREHKINHVAIAMTRYRRGEFDRDNGCCDFAGDIGLEPSARELLGKLMEKLDTSIANWSFPPSDPDLDASYVRYNMLAGPLGFDFLVWLVEAEMIRVREGAPAPLKVAFWMGKNEEAAHRQGWLNNVLRPALPMLGAVEDSLAIHGRCKEFYLSGDIVKAALAGENVPRFKPNIAFKVGQPPVTITLREAEYWPHRNSNIEAWRAFAKYLTKQGEHVIFVRDTRFARELMPGYHTYPTASLNLQHRLALYESAKCNLFVSNGPLALAIFGSRPWLAFMPIEPKGADFYAAEAEFWNEKQGIPVGTQYPWSTPAQRFVWKPDTYENIVEAWEAMNGEADLDVRVVPQPLRGGAAPLMGAARAAHDAQRADDPAVRAAHL